MPICRIGMSDATHNKSQDVAVIEAAQENSQGWTEKDFCEGGSVPGSPKSDSEWELLPDATASSDCCSSVTSGYINCAPDSICSPLETINVAPHLHIKLTPQGGSDVSLQLTVQDRASSSLSSTTVLCKQEQQDYQDQLHKAQQTLLPQATSADTLERSDMLSAHPQQKCTMFDALEGHDTAAPSVADPTLPTSTHPLVQEDILDILSAADNASCPCSSRLLNSHSTGHLSVNSDGSFMHVEGLASADDLPCHEEPETTQELATPVDLPEPAALTAFAQDASSVLDRVSEDMSGHATEASITHTNKESGASFLDIITCHWSLVIADSVAIVQEQSAAEPDRAHTYPSWPRLAAAIQHRLTQLLSSLQVPILSQLPAALPLAPMLSLQVWASSAYGCLPSSASIYASTASMFGSKSPLRCLDRGHWSLVSGLVAVSAVYLMREHGLNSRERRLSKELTNSQAEISKLIMKIVNMQHSMQSPGRVPIIRHTCTMSTVTPLPLMHLV